MVPHVVSPVFQNGPPEGLPDEKNRFQFLPTISIDTPVFMRV
jgi:hypothetical protein